MLWVQASYGPVILHPNQECAACAVRQAHDCLDQFTVGQRPSIALELYRQRLTLCDQRPQFLWCH
jgi:hypothetical protein